MSSLNIIQNTGSKELYEINKLSGGVGFPTLDAYRWPFKDKEFKKVRLSSHPRMVLLILF
jgi:hypothetical protein